VRTDAVEHGILTNAVGRTPGISITNTVEQRGVEGVDGTMLDEAGMCPKVKPRIL
jgi:hypothetical protein